MKRLYTLSILVIGVLTFILTSKSYAHDLEINFDIESDGSIVIETHSQDEYEKVIKKIFDHNQKVESL